MPEPNKISLVAYVNVIPLKLFCAMVSDDVIVFFIINRPSKSVTFTVNWNGGQGNGKLDGLKT